VPSMKDWTLRGWAVALKGGQVCYLRYEVLADEVTFIR